ncbi:peptidoglycan DD-metalloendopeptidase family protein [Streptomyces sp. TRM76323]|uniref:Peptidoglycan DD-metalloendopeptidase family protein n=1 Tax=Streptomyces tamarix TaxID=3078565 RepID=A0ABU3QTN1_9ACTN|nr:peptidoglycan DD-metalloendopeptidase family protein [Streptomyces tamarix]MDT9686103.1 peptidoglycan DD-metalloendopeptidase family protein [Streptomyces tamarix]
MPAKGKHRRIKSSPLTRGFVAAGTGGAAIALPLLGATGAHAAAPATAPAAAPAQTAAVASAAGTAKPAPRVYTVVAGDYLAKIAHNKNVEGGWKKLYADNREAIGDDPALIHPGLKLTLGAKATARADDSRGERASRSAAKTQAPAEVQAPAEAKPAADTPAEAETQAPAETQTPAQSGSGFTAPVSAGITTPYRASGSMWSSGYHTGVDFAASSGSTVKAVGPGTVVSAGWSGAYGNEVVIKHEDGNYSQYAHLSSLSVSAGQTVGGGQQIGLSGSTGNSTGPHLHFEIRTSPSYGSDVDPLAYLRSHGVSI